MERLTWELAERHYNEYKKDAETEIQKARHWINQYPHQLNSEEGLHGLLAQLNVNVLKLGELQGKLLILKVWTEKQLDVEKAKGFVATVKSGKAANYANGSKYLSSEIYLDQFVQCAGLHARVQNARAAARDTTEGIRSRISTIKGSLRNV